MGLFKILFKRNQGVPLPAATAGTTPAVVVQMTQPSEIELGMILLFMCGAAGVVVGVGMKIWP